MKGNNDGFSLVELIIVIAIMAVIVGILAPQFIKYVEQSRESKDLQNIEEMKKAVEAYSTDHEQKGIHVVEATGAVLKYVLGDGGSLQPYGVESQITQSSSNKIVLKWQYEDYMWSLVSDQCFANGAWYDAKGSKR